MGEINDFVVAQVTPNLSPGEQIKGTGAAVTPVKGPAFHHYLVAATDRRLVLIKTDNKTMSDDPKALNKGFEVWEYADLEEVSVSAVGGGVGMIHKANAVILKPLAGRGPLNGQPRRLHIRPKVGGCDDQPRLRNEFPQWLSQQVAAGAFGGGPAAAAGASAAVAAEQAANQQAAAAANAAAAAERAAAKANAPPSKPKSWIGVGCLAAPVLLVAMVLFMVALKERNGMDRFDREIARAEEELQATNDDWIAGRARRDAERARERRDAKGSDAMMFGCSSCCGLISCSASSAGWCSFERSNWRSSKSSTGSGKPSERPPPDRRYSSSNAFSSATRSASSASASGKTPWKRRTIASA